MIDCKVSFDDGTIKKLTIQQAEQLRELLDKWLNSEPVKNFRNLNSINNQKEIYKNIEVSNVPDKQKITTLSSYSIVDKIKNEVSSTNISDDWIEIGKEREGNKSFIYEKNPNDHTYRLKVIEGKKISKYTLGNMYDKESKLRILWETLPNDDVFTTTDVLKMRANDKLMINFLSFRRIKASIYVLTLEDYITRKKEPLEDRRGLAIGYYKNQQKISELKAFETNGKHKPLNASNSLGAQDKSHKLLSVPIQ